MTGSHEAPMAGSEEAVVESIRGEYRRYRHLLEQACAQMSDDALFAEDGGDLNSAATVVSHLAGNLRSRFTEFLDTDGEKPWRERDQEFESPAEAKAQGRAALFARMDASWGILDGALDEVTARVTLDRQVTIRQQPLTVVEALHRSLAHTAYHVGQVVWIARAAAGSEWTTLSVAKGGSAAYAANPDRERPPA